jgi:hypothetical protein
LIILKLTGAKKIRVKITEMKTVKAKVCIAKVDIKKIPGSILKFKMFPAK